MHVCVSVHPCIHPHRRMRTQQSAAIVRGSEAKDGIMCASARTTWSMRAWLLAGDWRRSVREGLPLPEGLPLLCTEVPCCLACCLGPVEAGLLESGGVGTAAGRDEEAAGVVAAGKSVWST